LISGDICILAAAGGCTHVPGILAPAGLEILDSELGESRGLVPGQVAHVDVGVAILPDPHEVEDVGEAQRRKLLDHAVVPQFEISGLLFL
jgi:hypothetical protein